MYYYSYIISNTQYRIVVKFHMLINRIIENSEPLKKLDLIYIYIISRIKFDKITLNNILILSEINRNQTKSIVYDSLLIRTKLTQIQVSLHKMINKSKFKKVVLYKLFMRLGLFELAWYCDGILKTSAFKSEESYDYWIKLFKYIQL